MTSSKLPRPRLLGVAAKPIGKELGSALRLAVAPMAASLMLLGILMGPTGMQPADLIGAMESSMLVRSAIWVAWLAAFAPAVVEIGRVDLSYLRWLPIPRTTFWLGWFATIALINAPLALLMAVADGPFSGVTTAAIAIGFHTAILARGIPAVGLAGGVLLAAIASPPETAAAVGTIAIAIAIPRGIRRACEGRREPFAASLQGGPLRGLATLFASRIATPMFFVRIVAAAIVFGALGGLVVSVNELGPRASVLVVVGATSLGIVGLAAHIGGKSLQLVSELGWILRTTATDAAMKTAAVATAVTVTSVLAASCIAGVAVAVSQVSLSTGAVAIACSIASAIAIALMATCGAALNPERANLMSWLAALLFAAVLNVMIAGLGTLGLVIVPTAVVVATALLHDKLATVEATTWRS